MLLASEHSISVYNMAFGGYGPAHNLLQLDEALALTPARIIISIYLGNDFYDGSPFRPEIPRLVGLFPRNTWRLPNVSSSRLQLT